MSKGYFVDADGVAVYYGTRTDKPQLEDSHTWIDGAKKQPTEDHTWDGSKWEFNQPRKDARDALKTDKARFARMNNDPFAKAVIRGLAEMRSETEGQTRIWLSGLL